MNTQERAIAMHMEMMEKEKQMFKAVHGMEQDVDQFVDPARSMLHVMDEVRHRGWEYELSSAEPWHDDDGEVLRIGGHEATIRVPKNVEVTVLAFSPDVAIVAAYRGAMDALKQQDPKSR